MSNTSTTSNFLDIVPTNHGAYCAEGTQLKTNRDILDCIKTQIEESPHLAGWTYAGHSFDGDGLMTIRAEFEANGIRAFIVAHSQFNCAVSGWFGCEDDVSNQINLPAESDFDTEVTWILNPYTSREWVLGHIAALWEQKLATSFADEYL